MSDDSSEPKKYPPTEKKLQDLAKKGQFPKTELAEPTLELFVFICVFTSIIYMIFDQSNEWLTVLLYVDIPIGLDIMLSIIGFSIGLLMLLKLTMAVFNWVMINKCVINTESLGLKMDKLSPVNGVKNIFGVDALSRSFRKIFELLLLLFILKYVFDISSGEISELVEINNFTSFLYNLLLIVFLFSVIFIVFGVTAGSIDFLAEKYHFHQKNKMTFTEMKNEMKETEGSPEVKSERRRLMREVMESPITKGRKPDFALANPTHILVPICYDPSKEKIPVVLKISTDDLAQEEKHRLVNNDVPVIEHKALAQAFYAKMKSGEDFIPKEFYRDVALILSALNKYKKERKNAKDQQKRNM